MRAAKSMLAGAIVSLATGLGVTADPIRIGFNVPLTGFAATDGRSALEGARLAVDQVNSAGGIGGDPIKLLVYDDQASPKEATLFAVKMAAQGNVVAGISGSYSGPTRAAAAVFQENEIPYISAYAVHPDITRAGDYVFRTSFTGEVQGRAGAKLIGDVMRLKRVALITLGNDFGRSLASGFKDKAPEFGIEITGESEYAIDDREFGPVVSKVKADAPEAIYASGYFFTAGPLVRQIRAAGIDVPIVGQEGYDSQKFIEIAGPAAEGVIITTSLDRDATSPVTRAFMSAFERRAAFPADMVAASTHTAILVLADALKRSATGDRAALRDAVAASNVDASTGRISFNALGEVKKDVQVQVAKGGAWHHYAVISDPILLSPPEK
ncbi:MAG: ABC transporter substrate-binding protein [Boseongicola sp. SB0662_bin_57]|nr:ABC transporter substrate-binding protein [Boseongicola sp. SB0662_bin_57]